MPRLVLHEDAKNGEPARMTLKDEKAYKELKKLEKALVIPAVEEKEIEKE